MKNKFIFAYVALINFILGLCAYDIMLEQYHILSSSFIGGMEFVVKLVATLVLIICTNMLLYLWMLSENG